MRREIYLIIFGLLILSNLYPIQAITYEQGTNFTYEIEVEMDGTSYEYSGYSEEEHEIRTYELLSVEGETVNWRLHREFEYSSNEGDDISTTDDYLFSTNKITRAYVQDSDIPQEWDGDYYEEDYLWFRIHPDEMQKGDSVRILGHDYNFVGYTDIRLDLTTAVEAMVLETKNQQTIVNNKEYDPDGQLVINFDETFYYDPNTGYLLKSHWDAVGETSKGNFDWEEEIKLTDASFTLENSIESWITVNLGYLLFGGGFILVSGFLFYNRKKDLENQVLDAIDVVSGKKSIDFKSFQDKGPTVWNPIELDYTYILDKNTGDQRIL